MLRAAGAFLLTAGSTAAGLSSALRLRRKAAALRELEDALRLMEGEISTTAAPLPEICERLGRLHGTGGSFFRAVSEELGALGERPAAELWARAAEKCRGIPPEIGEMGIWIGRYDRERELRALEDTRQRLRALREETEEKSTREFRTRTAIGFASGAAAAILLM